MNLEGCGVASVQPLVGCFCLCGRTIVAWVCKLGVWHSVINLISPLYCMQNHERPHHCMDSPLNTSQTNIVSTARHEVTRICYKFSVTSTHQSAIAWAFSLAALSTAIIPAVGATPTLSFAKRSTSNGLGLLLCPGLTDS